MDIIHTSQFTCLAVIPAKAGIHIPVSMDSRLRGNNDFSYR